MVSNSAAVSTATPCSFRKRSTSRRMVSPLTKATYCTPASWPAPTAGQRRQRVARLAGQYHLLVPPRLDDQLPQLRGNDTRPKSAIPSCTRS